MKPRQVLPLLLLFLALTALAGEPTVKLPVEVKARPGRLTLLKAETDGKVLRWVSLSDGADLLPYLEHQAIFSAPAPGRYQVLAYTAAGDVPSEPALCTVVVEGAPTPPSPGPAPTPPAPPGPNPNPPGPSPSPPSDPLVQALQAAYAADADPNKARSLQALIALYRRASEAASQPEVTTWGQLFDTLARSAATLGVRGKLSGVQAAVQAELKKRLPSRRDLHLDADGRRLAATAFQYVATALEAVQ